MNEKQITDWASELIQGKLNVQQFLEQITETKTADLQFAQLDLDRRHRCGYPEVVFGEGKSVDTLRQIFTRLSEEGHDVFSTRISLEKAEQLLAVFSEAKYNQIGRTFRIAVSNNDSKASEDKRLSGSVAIITAGTSDLAVAEEARETLLWMGLEPTMISDVGVAGPHRLPDQLKYFQHCDAVVVIAGMEGALPSVVGGYLDCPVIAVPTSIGYGANFGGIAALLSMLNSCAANVTVVNIDAGFKAAYVAGLIARKKQR